MKKLTQNVKCVALALDGMSLLAARDLLEELFLHKNSIAEQMIVTIKLNDMLHGHSIDELRGLLNYVPEGIGFFLDLKLADVSATNGNIAGRYLPLKPAVITVRENISPQSLLAVREALPNTVIALVSALTDISEADFVEDYGMLPKEYIAKHLTKFERRLGSKNPLGAAVCSPLEVGYLKRKFPHLQFITPGIRDNWMPTDHQKRTMGVADALFAGANFLVMGAQIVKGNPAQVVSPETSRRKTFEEITFAVHGSYVNV